MSEVFAEQEGEGVEGGQGGEGGEGREGRRELEVLFEEALQAAQEAGKLPPSYPPAPQCTFYAKKVHTFNSLKFKHFTKFT